MLERNEALANRKGIIINSIFDRIFMRIFKMAFLLMLFSVVSFAATNVSTCQVINTPGVYELNASLYGAPNALPPTFVLDACIHIDSSNVQLDCKGFDITYNNTNGAIGIYVYQEDNVTVKNCLVSNMSYLGIALYYTNNSLVENNTVTNVTTGFILYDSDDSVVTDNTAYGNSLNGFTLSADSTNNNLTNNVARDNGQTGFSLSSACNSNRYTNNFAYRNTREGFDIQSSNSNNLSNNEAYNNSYNGFKFASSSSGTIVNNNAYFNNLSGFSLSGGNSNNLSGNNAYNNNESGFFLAYDSDSNTLSSNKAYNNLDYGLYILYSNNTNVSDARLYNNTLGEFYILTDANPRFVSLNSVIFDNPLGNLANYTNLSLSDSVEASSLYTIKWSTNSTALPSNTMSFLQKFVDISASASIIIDAITWNWLQGEVTGSYDESLFEIWEYSASWIQTSALLDTSANTLTIANLDPASIYGILQYNDTSLPSIALNNPTNGYSAQVAGTTNITFNFTATDDHYSTLNCSINLDGSSIYSNSSVLNNTATIYTSPVAVGSHTWNVTCLDGGANSNSSATYSFTLSFPGSPSSSTDSKKSLSVSTVQLCPGNSFTVNVTSGTNPLTNAFVRLIHQTSFEVEDKDTDSSGSVTFDNLLSGDYKLIATKSGYTKSEQSFTFSACSNEVEKPEEKLPEPPPVEPPPTPTINITIPPSLEVLDQMLKDSEIIVDNAFFDKAGCIILHLVNADGSPGAVVGMSDVISGNYSDLELDLINYANETSLMAMLHYDGGDGICDPDKDAPATVNGKPVAVNFKLTLPPAAPPVEPPKPPVTQEPPVQPPVEEEGMDLLGIILIIVILAVIIGGAGVAWMMLKKK
jgi:parallel beta-helix repeat protein